MRDFLAVLLVSGKLAFQGVLVQDMWGSALRAAVAAAAGALAGAAALLAGGPLWAAALLGGLLAGALAPYLLRNIKIA